MRLRTIGLISTLALGLLAAPLLTWTKFTKAPNLPTFQWSGWTASL